MPINEDKFPKVEYEKFKEGDRVKVRKIVYDLVKTIIILDLDDFTNDFSEKDKIKKELDKIPNPIN